MATIDELMAGKAPGGIRIKRVSWMQDVWFQPYYAFRKIWYGPSNNIANEGWEGSEPSWELWQEPKPKVVVRWLWVHWAALLDRWELTSMYLTEREAAYHFYPSSKPVKLEWSRTEFDE